MTEQMRVRRKAPHRSSCWRCESSMSDSTASSGSSWSGHRFDQIALYPAQRQTLADTSSVCDTLRCAPHSAFHQITPVLTDVWASIENAGERQSLGRHMVRLTQRRDSSTAIVQRQFETEEPVCRPDAMVNLARIDRLDVLEHQIDAVAQENRDRRRQLDEVQECSSETAQLQHDLDRGRSHLLDLLEERRRLLTEEIESLYARAGPNPTCSAEHPEMTDSGNQLRVREQQLQRTLQQIAPLRRWHMRHQIGQINEQIAAIDAELSTLPQVCDPADMVSMLLYERRAELERQRSDLAAALTGSAHEYEQFDPRWGAQRYGNSPECTNIAAAGCGPTSLAIVLNYLYQEDPENLASGGQIEIVTPPQTAQYAATHGRVCNSGTAGDTMVTNVHTGFPGFRGRRISLNQAVDHLRSGNLVIFLCRNCTGRNRSGGDKTYGGHYMVLNGVNADGTVFNVLDPGANEARDILTITRENLAGHNAGFWIIERI